MKLSDKILIGLLAIVFVYITAAFAEMRILGDPNRLNDSNSILETIDIPELGYLKLEGLDMLVHVAGAEAPAIEVRSIKGHMVGNVDYTILNDTLSIKGLNFDDDDNVKITVKIPYQGFRGISSEYSSLIIDNLGVDTLSLKQRSGWSRIRNDNKFDRLNLDISDDGYVHLSETELSTVNLKLDSSEVGIFSPVQRLEGSMMNKSYLHVRGCYEIQFKKDSTSAFYLN